MLRATGIAIAILVGMLLGIALPSQDGYRYESAGYEKGLEEGTKEGYLEGFVTGRFKGYREGFAKGYELARKRADIFQVEGFPCEEDEPAVIGSGDFDGREWDSYSCLHVDRIR